VGSTTAFSYHRQVSIKLRKSYEQLVYLPVLPSFLPQSRPVPRLWAPVQVQAQALSAAAAKYKQYRKLLTYCVLRLTQPPTLSGAGNE